MILDEKDNEDGNVEGKVDIEKDDDDLEIIVDEEL